MTRGTIKIRLNKVIPSPEGLLREERLDFLFAIAANAKRIWIINHGVAEQDSAHREAFGFVAGSVAGGAVPNPGVYKVRRRQKLRTLIESHSFGKEGRQGLL